MTEEENAKVKVQAACCPICGTPWKLAATETTFNRSTTREFAKMMEQGFIIRSMTLNEAQGFKIYCKCFNWRKVRKGKKLERSVATEAESGNKTSGE